MSKLRLSFLVAVVVLLAGATLAQAGDQDFTLTNDTGLAIHHLFVSPSKSDQWGPDILGVDVLEDGADAEITFAPTAKAAVWDLKIVDEEGDAIVWAGLRLTEISSVTLHYEGGKPTATIE